MNHDDAVLQRYLSLGEGSSPFIYLSEIFLFYEESPAIVYVSYTLFVVNVIHKCMYVGTYIAMYNYMYSMA